MSHLSVHIGSNGRIVTVLQPRTPTGTFASPVSLARPAPRTAHVADYTSGALPRISRTSPR